MEPLRHLPEVRERESTPAPTTLLEVYTNLEGAGIDAKILKAAADLGARERLAKAIMDRYAEAVKQNVVEVATETNQQVMKQIVQAPEEIFVTPELPAVNLDGKFIGHLNSNFVDNLLTQNGKFAGVPLNQLSLEMFDFDFTPRIPGINDANDLTEFRRPNNSTLSPIESAHYGRLASCTYYLAPHIAYFPELLTQLHLFADRFGLDAEQTEWMLANFYHNLTVKYLSQVNGLSSKTNIDDLDKFVENNSLSNLSEDTRDTDLVIAMLYAQSALVGFGQSEKIAESLNKLEDLYAQFLSNQFSGQECY